MRLSRFRINSEITRQRIAIASKSPSRPTKLAAFPLALLSIFLALAIALIAPIQAFADYSNPSLHTVAQMRTDGSLRVVEQRAFAFEESYAAIAWPFTGITEKQEVAIAAVRIIQMDEEGNIVRDWDQLPEVAFQLPWRELMEETDGEADKVEAAQEKLAKSDDATISTNLPTSDSYTFDARRSMLYVFLESTEHSTVIECDYAVSNAALVYDDTAEMYWDYVPEQPDVDMSNVRTQVQLPVPEGTEVIPGDTIRAWGHGPEGTVDVRPDGTVHYEVPQVRAGQYAQAHILFPRSWLTNISVQSKLAKSGTRFDDAVAEEASWTDTYTWGVVNSLWMDIATLVLCIIALLGTAAAYVAWGRERNPDEACKPSAQDAPCNAKDTPVDAAVLGRLLRWNQHSAYDFAATLRQLQDHGVITISQDGPDVGDVRFRITPSAKSADLSQIEQSAMKLLFDTAGDEYQSVSLREVQAFCKKRPAEAREAMGKWQKELSTAVSAANVFDRRSRKASRWLYGLGAAFALLGIIDSQVASLALLTTGIVMLVVAYNLPHRTPNGVCLAEGVGEAETSEDQNGPAEWEVQLASAFGDALTA